MKNILYIIIIGLLFFLVGCATPRSEPLPDGPKGESIIELSRSMKTDKSPTIRVASALALGKIGCKYPDIELVHVMHLDQSFQVKIAAIRSLGELGGPYAIKSLREYSIHYSMSANTEKSVIEELDKAIKKAGGK